MSDVTVEHKESLSREQAAAWLHVLSRALHKGGEAALPVGPTEESGTTVSLRLPDALEAEFEVTVDGDEVQIEVELTWSLTPGREDGGGEEPEAGDDTEPS